MKYQAVYERSRDGSIWGYCPDVPGVSGAGDTLDEAKQSLRSGLGLWLEQAKVSGLTMPESTFIASEVIEISAG